MLKIISYLINKRGESGNIGRIEFNLHTHKKIIEKLILFVQPKQNIDDIHVLCVVREVVGRLA